MNKDQIVSICDNLIDHLTVLKGFVELGKLNNKVNHSLVILDEINSMEIMVTELVNKLLSLDE
ncbi:MULTISPECIES: hypothetical protein [Desulfosporosinus]|uniref:Uncharacterized protein n=1 Tax=Desulfosporosinus meridiei (strain ATCC BAA-275 / DSM 13257 / KCTC 12902 / NCIMB 13706 / S10) TaxID=768704 RepID=J7IXS6_DESMD|nr:MULTISPECIES: hypothetical protein [Desulfosporosinus]AFQ43903.1 hypothetical protein Desmer_1953 [Desulfosporosinus meridiei DSM 13257]MCB8815290.1 hypothetical protein [Desulfosporosinus sp. SRJS8]